MFQNNYCLYLMNLVCIFSLCPLKGGGGQAVTRTTWKYSENCILNGKIKYTSSNYQNII